MEMEYIGLGIPKPSDPAFVPPAEFLEWAITDLKGKNRRNIGNALGNIKRSIHCQIDEIVGRTRVTHCVDWTQRNTSTEDKLLVLTTLGVQHRSVLSLITESRNDFEHTYLLPSLKQVEAYLDVATMWLEKVDREHTFPSVGFIGLPLIGHACDTPDKSGNVITHYQFDPNMSGCVKYFDETDLVEIDTSGNETRVPFRSFRWRELLKLEVQPRLDCSRSFNRQTLAMLRILYREWLKDPKPGMIKIR